MNARRVATTLAAAAVVAAAAWLLVPGRAEDYSNGAPHAPLVEAEADSLPRFDDPRQSVEATQPEPIADPLVERDALADSAPLATDTVVHDRLDLELTFADGSPARGVPVVLGRGEEVVARGTTDRSGRLLLDAGEAPLTLYAAGVGLDVHVEVIDFPPGDHRVILPQGATISGVLTVRGELLETRCVALTLRLEARRAQQELPSAVRHALEGSGAWGEGYGFNSQRVTRDVGFEFSELVAGESYVIGLPEAFMAADRQRQVAVTAPTSGLRIDLLELPAIRGRAVLGDTMLPIPNCSVQCRVDYHTDRPAYYASSESEPKSSQSELKPGQARARLGATGSISLTFSADDMGRFRVPLERPVASATLDLLDSGSGSRLQLAVEGVDDVAGKDLGDVALDLARVVRFQVLDSGSTPIAGALGIVEGERTQRSQPTGSDGFGELHGVPEGDVAIAFTAPGFDTARRSVEGAADQVLDVRLAHCAMLEVQVASHANELPEGLLLQIASSEQPFSGDQEFGPEPYRAEFGATHWTESNKSVLVDKDGKSTCVGGQIRYPVPSSGLVSISCLRPQVSMKLSIVDDRGAAVSSEEPVVLSVGETRRVELWIAAGPAQSSPSR